MANEIVRKHGYFATFMPKPFADRSGSGAHFNMSLYDLETKKNLFAVPHVEDPRGLGLTKLGYQFIAGVLKHGPALCAAFAPTVNSYKRLTRRGAMATFSWAPVFNSYGSNNRTNSIRVPMGGGRCESRNADGAANPYLAAALALAAGACARSSEMASAAHDTAATATSTRPRNVAVDGRVRARVSMPAQRGVAAYAARSKLSGWAWRNCSSACAAACSRNCTSICPRTASKRAGVLASRRIR
jgi:glutamine synthetase